MAAMVNISANQPSKTSCPVTGSSTRQVMPATTALTTTLGSACS